MAASSVSVVSGMDSLSAVEFRNRLSSELPSLDLPNTRLGGHEVGEAS